MATTDDNTMTTAGRKMGIFYLSQSGADWIFKISNGGLIIGALLVFLGTLGAIWSGNIRERYSDERTARNEKDTAAAKATAATANDHAASANERAATANQNAAQANERTEALRQSNLKLETELEKERAERLRLEASIAPRQLSDQQRSQLVAALQAVPHPILIQFILIADMEASNYGHSILGALGEAKIRGQVVKIGEMPPRYGVFLTVQKGNQKSLAVKAAFEGANIPMNVSYGDVGDFDAIIEMGKRPLGPSH